MTKFDFSIALRISLESLPPVSMIMLSKALFILSISSPKLIPVLDTAQIATLIKPSGFYNTKAKRLKGFLNALQKDFGDLANFKASVSKQWLLSVKGLGFESSDSILNYLCQREILVVDSYTARLALALGYEFESYDELREFFESGVESEQDELNEILRQNAKFSAQNSTNSPQNSLASDKNLSANSTNLSPRDKNLFSCNANSSQNLTICDKKSKNFNANSRQNYALYELYQIFHALIIAFGKSYFKGKNLNDKGKAVLAKFMG